MKRKLLSIVLAAILTASATIPAFAADTGSTKTQSSATGSAITTSNSSITVSGSSVTVSGSSITATGSSVTITGAAITVKEPAKKLSLNEALKIMTTTGVRAETANLNKQSDLAVARGYGEKSSSIKKAQTDINNLELYLSTKSPAEQQAILASKGISSIAELSYEAQVQGVTSSNKKILGVRRDFANNNAENNYQADMNQIRQDTLNIYSTVLLAEDNYKIAQDNLAAHQKNLKDVNAKKAVGLLSKKDVLQAQTALSDAEKEVRAAKTKMDYAHMSFNYLLGYHVLQEVNFTDKLEIATSEAIDVELAVKNALANRNEIKGADFATEIYKLLLDTVKDYPQNSATYLNAEIKYLTSQKTAKDARVQIEIDIRNRAADVADKKAALDAAKSLQTYAQEGMRLLKLTNEEGLSTVEELLTTQVSLYKANLNVAKATSDYNLALKAFEDAQGVGTMRIPL